MLYNLTVTKYKEYVGRMFESEKDAFNDFKIIHDKYALEEDKWQDEFNKEGGKILKVIQAWENKLCGNSEKAGYGSYTGGLAEKFRAEIKKTYPMIDYIGIISKKEPSFFLKKINLK